MFRPVAILFLCVGTGVASAQTLPSSAGDLVLTEMVGGLDTPWAVGILPNGDFLVTERDGEVLFVRDGQKQPVAGVPRVAASGQGGLLDITVARDFERSREVFLTFSKPQQGGADRRPHG